MMQKSVTARSCAAAGLALAALYAGSAVAVTTSTGGNAPFAPHQATTGHVRLRGTLVALHRSRRTGDLALPNGNLVPLRFASVAQENRLHVGDRLLVAADAHGHARLVVRTVRVEAAGAHWFGSHWYGNHWWMHGVVGRFVGHGNAEVLGVNGAAVVVQVNGAHVTSGPQGAAHTAAPASAAVAYAESAPRVFAGELINTQVTLTRRGTLAALSVQVVATHVARLDIEGTVTAVNRAAGTVTIVNEDGQATVVAMGARAAGYHVGQDAEVSGAPRSGSGDATVIHAQDAEHENGAPGAPTPAPTATPSPADPSGDNGQATPWAAPTGTPGSDSQNGDRTPGNNGTPAVHAVATGTPATGNVNGRPVAWTTPPGTPAAHGGTNGNVAPQAMPTGMPTPGPSPITKPVVGSGPQAVIQATPAGAPTVVVSVPTVVVGTPTPVASVLTVPTVSAAPTSTPTQAASSQNGQGGNGQGGNGQGGNGQGGNGQGGNGQGSTPTPQSAVTAPLSSTVLTMATPTDESGQSH